MKILILGGPLFVGFHLIEAALARGHEVSLFNRGRTFPDLFPDIRKYRGDRDGGLQVLQGGRWDAVIDTCGYVPRIVRDSAALLAEAVDHYTFISSISVYAEPGQEKIDEAAPLNDRVAPEEEEVNAETYGPLKVHCEQAAEAAMPGRVLNLRPGLIVGPRDPTDRFTYWPARIAAGGEVLAPDSPDVPVQFVDVRDLAEWNIRMVEAGKTGVYNVTGPSASLTLGTILDTAQAAAGSQASFSWVSEAFLLAREIAPFTQVPLWVPRARQALMRVSIDKALQEGLTFRPLEATIGDVLDWHRSRRADHQLGAGLEASQERQLLAEWHRQGRPS